MIHQPQRQRPDVYSPIRHMQIIRGAQLNGVCLVFASLFFSNSIFLTFCVCEWVRCAMASTLFRLGGNAVFVAQMLICFDFLWNVCEPQLTELLEFILKMICLLRPATIWRICCAIYAHLAIHLLYKWMAKFPLTTLHCFRTCAGNRGRFWVVANMKNELNTRQRKQLLSRFEFWRL